MPTEQRCSLEKQRARDEMNAFLSVIGTKIDHYMKHTQEKAVEHWLTNIKRREDEETAVNTLGVAEEALRGLLDAYEKAFDWADELPPETVEAERVANEVLSLCAIRSGKK